MAKLIKLWTALEASYWFVPSLMCLAAAIASFVLTAVDGWLGNDWVSRLPWVYRIQASGARDVLTTVAGSMIGVAGVTFSITIAALSYTTTTLGPRLLTNFMSDKDNQITLGTFLATFVYCVLLLRTIQSSGNAAQAFIPNLSIVFAIGLAMASLAVLIYFIHHIAESLHVSNVIGDIASELDQAIAGRDASGGQQTDTARHGALPANFAEAAVAASAQATGYIQNIVHPRLMQLARQHDLVLRLRCVPGDFVAEGQPIADVWPAARIDDTIQQRVAGAYAIGRRRTQSQDVLFLVNELVEIAARALSPGTNDPYTAMSCLDWLTAALARMAQSDLPGPARVDNDGTLRIWAPVFDFKALADAICDQLRCYFATDINATEHMLERLGSVGRTTRRDADRALLRRHAGALYEAALDNADNARDRQRIEHAHTRAKRRLSHPATRPGSLPA